MSAESQPADKFVTINGLQLHYLDWGGESDRFLVLLHGLTSNAHSWDHFASRHCQEYRILALDQRGHGDSDHAKEGYPVTAFASDLAGFVKSLELDRFDLCGLSLGARNAMAYSGDHWPSLKHLILVDFGPEMVASGAKRVMTNVDVAPAGFRSLEEAVAYTKNNSPTYRPEFIENHARHSLRQNWVGRLVYKYDRELFWITGSAGKKEVPYLWDQLSKTQCPTLVMRGAGSDILAPEIAKRMVDILPKGSFVEIPDSTHPIPMENPEGFENAVREFLAK